MSAWEYLLQPAILFFLLGVLAVIVKSGSNPLFLPLGCFCSA
jgi:hypothetical protein